MKILELTRSFYPSIGGMQKFVDDRLKIYQSLEYRFHVITTNTKGKQLENPKMVKGVKYLQSYTPYVITPKLSKALDEDYDILSVNEIGYFYSDYAIRRAFKDKKKIVLTPHFFFHTDKYKIIKVFYSKFILPKTLGKINKIICFTETEKQFWVDKFSFLVEKVEIIPHYFLPSKIEERIDEYSTEKFFLYIGRGGRNKRTDLLIEAFSELKTDYELCLTIDEDDLSYTLQNIVTLNNNIKLLGHVSEEHKHNLLSNCSALVFPTDYEAFGIVNLEASIYQKPLIVSHLDIFKNILNADGVIYFDNNIKSIKQAIVRFLKLSFEKKKKMGKVNYDNLDRYSLSKIKQQYFDLYSYLYNSLIS